ncbi:hypothetical protein BH10ACI4_BH10ACI4_05740 [soil metagenome]
MVLAGLEYFAAVLIGLMIAFLPTLLVSWAILPPDGPPGEGFAILLLYFVFACFCVPGYAKLMSLHRQGRKDTRGLIACEIILRISFLVAACFIGFIAIKLPISILTKWITCLAVIPVGAWAIKPVSVP